MAHLAQRALRPRPLLLVLVAGLLTGCPVAAMNRAASSSPRTVEAAGDGGGAPPHVDAGVAPDGGVEGAPRGETVEGGSPMAPEEGTPREPTTLAEQLDGARVRDITVADRLVLSAEGHEQRVRALALADDTRAHVCVSHGTASRCWSMPFAALSVGDVSVWESEGRVRVQLGFGHAEGGQVSVVVHGEELQATWTRSASPAEPVDAVRSRERPALFEQLAGLELAMSGATLVARRDAEVRVCRRREAGFACTQPEELPALTAERSALHSVQEDFSGLVAFEYTWEEQLGDVYTFGQALVFVRASETDLQPLAHVVIGYRRRSRVSLESDDIENVDLEMYDVEARQAGCLFAGPVTLRRTVERANGTTRTLPAARLRRAPDVVPAEGLDPLAYRLSGAWALQPEGGLRRIAGCEYEDD